MKTPTQRNRTNASPAALFAVLISFVLTGCVRNQYDIELNPEQETLNRTLSAGQNITGTEADDTVPDADKSGTASLPEAELQQLAKVYRQSPNAADGKYVFRSKFVGATPDDIGGSGNFTYWKSSMGTVSLYTERFRGNDDLAAILDERHKATDTITKLLIGWLRSEIGDDPDFPNLHKFVDTKLRHDLRNLALYFWTAETLEVWKPTADSKQPPWNTGEFHVRTARYLMERDYLTPETLTKLIQAIRDDEEERLLQFSRTLVASKMNIDSDAAALKRLKFLSTTKRMAVSLQAYPETTDEYKSMLKSKKADNKANPDESQPEARELLFELLFRATGIGLRGGDDL